MLKSPRLMISATHKSAGKTIFSLGLLAHLASIGQKIRPFKKGPDYIDPMWLKKASGNECYNLDPYMMGEEGCIESFTSHSKNYDLSLIEGNHGLHDGMSLNGKDSSAGLAEILDAPVLLVIDSRGMNRGVASVVLGVQQLIPKVKLVGIILNRTKSQRQVDKQKLAIEHYCGIPVLGAIREDQTLNIPERHLGLTSVEESGDVESHIQTIKDQVALQCNLKSIIGLFDGENLSNVCGTIEQRENPKKPDDSVRESSFRIGVFRDAAFCFYYPDNLESLRQQGAEMVDIDSLHDSSLPEVDGLYIGGGFPESFLSELAGNLSLIRDLKDRVRSGIPLYAECGGLIYLYENTEYQGSKHKLAGILEGNVGYRKKPYGYGYLELESKQKTPWFNIHQKIKAHEFHYSKPFDLANDKDCQFNVLRGYGMDGIQDGVLHQNVLASYAHIHSKSTPEWSQNFAMLAQDYHEKINSA